MPESSSDPVIFLKGEGPKSYVINDDSMAVKTQYFEDAFKDITGAGILYGSHTKSSSIAHASGRNGEIEWQAELVRKLDQEMPLNPKCNNDFFQNPKGRIDYLKILTNVSKEIRKPKAVVITKIGIPFKKGLSSTTEVFEDAQHRQEKAIDVVIAYSKEISSGLKPFFSFDAENFNLLRYSSGKSKFPTVISSNFGENTKSNSCLRIISKIDGMDEAVKPLEFQVNKLYNMLYPRN
jgi:hypothetical protein